MDNSLFRKIRAGDVASIARAISQVENDDPAVESLLDLLHPCSGNALIWGVTGPPGSGKSTLVNTLIPRERACGRRVAVVAVDPSSPVSGGAFLGDRLRMSGHGDHDVYIRSMATRGNIGGLALATSDVLTILDAAGFETIIVETVGTGQSDVAITELADVVILMLVPGMGDDIQLFKSGILEMADIIALNKKDRPGAEELGSRVRAALATGGAAAGGSRAVLTISALTGDGVNELAKTIRTRADTLRQDGTLAVRRRARLSMVLRGLYERKLRQLLETGLDLPKRIEEWGNRVLRGEAMPHELVTAELERISKRLRVTGS